MPSPGSRLLGLACLVWFTTACVMERDGREPVPPGSESAEQPGFAGGSDQPTAGRTVRAPESRRVPDLAQAFPTETLTIEHREGAIGWYLYETNLEFEVLRQRLLEYLGDEWSVAPHDLEAENKLRFMSGGLGITAFEMAVFVNDRLPGVTISLHLNEQRSDLGEARRFANLLESDEQAAGSGYITLPALLKSLAEGGDVGAQSRMGFACFSGQGREQDTSEAIRWWRKAAAQGDALAQYSLGTCYFLGHGVLTNHRIAVGLYRKAASQGLADAQCALGICYDQGSGVEVDHGEAVRYYRMAANQGLEKAQFNLGVSYFLGEGVNQDPVAAYAWLALSNGETGRARAQLDHLEQDLTAEQLAAGRELSEDLAARIGSGRTGSVNR